MTVDIRAAEQFVLANARLLDRHHLAVLLHDAPTAPVLDALRAYRNRHGGFGHALEPDVRGPESEPASTLHAPESEPASTLHALEVPRRDRRVGRSDGWGRRRLDRHDRRSGRRRAVRPAERG